jgi:hypothetical protein
MPYTEQEIKSAFQQLATQSYRPEKPYSIETVYLALQEPLNRLTITADHPTIISLQQELANLVTFSHESHQCSLLNTPKKTRLANKIDPQIKKITHLLTEFTSDKASTKQLADKYSQAELIALKQLSQAYIPYCAATAYCNDGWTTKRVIGKERYQQIQASSAITAVWVINNILANFDKAIAVINSRQMPTTLSDTSIASTTTTASSGSETRGATIIIRPSQTSASPQRPTYKTLDITKQELLSLAAYRAICCTDFEADIASQLLRLNDCLVAAKTDRYFKDNHDFMCPCCEGDILSISARLQEELIEAETRIEAANTAEPTLIETAYSWASYYVPSLFPPAAKPTTEVIEELKSASQEILNSARASGIAAR